MRTGWSSLKNKLFNDIWAKEKKNIYETIVRFHWWFQIWNLIASLTNSFEEFDVSPGAALARPRDDSKIAIEMTLLTADINYCLHLNEPQHSMSVQQLKFIFEINTTVPEALKPDQTCNKLFTTPQFGKSQQFVQFVKLFLIHQHGALLPEKNQDSSNTPERGLLVEGVSSIQDPCEVLQ